jgi:Trypsin-like peptidase domain
MTDDNILGPTFQLPNLPAVPGNIRLYQPEHLKPLIQAFFPEAILDLVVQEVLGQSLGAIAPNEMVAPDDIESVYGAVINRVIARIVAEKKIDALLSNLRRAGPRDPRFYLALTGLIDVDDRNLHAILGNVGEPFVGAAALKNRFPYAIDQVCAIWVDGEVKGTGFLVGPDLVLTCHHVVEDLVGAPSAYDAHGNTRLACLFDYLAATNVTRLEDLPPSIKIALASEKATWLIDASPPHPDDGRAVGHTTPNPADYLDFALIRLSERVGLSSIAAGGGRLRGWIDLPRQNPNLHQGCRLFILQHPAQTELQFDLGGYMTSIGGGTRLLYGTNATGGSSGGPCFDSKIIAVGLHSGACNVSGDPGKKVLANHGIRLDHIALHQKVSGVLDNIEERWDATVTAPIWSLSTDRKAPRPVVGRQKCFDYFASLLNPEAQKRVLVVTEPEKFEDRGGHGKSFTIHILGALLREQGHIMVPFAVAPERPDPPGRALEQVPPVSKQQLPDDPLKWITAIGRSLGWFGADFSDLPTPPGTRQSARWVSTDLPFWFARKLEEKARAAGLIDRSPQGREILTRLTWIVLDDIHRTQVTPDISDLLAGLVGVRLEESGVPLGLRSLRFLVTGHVPDVLRDAARLIEREEIDANDITVADLQTCVERAYRARAGLRDFDPAKSEPFSMGIIEFAKNTYGDNPKDYMRFIGGFMTTVVQYVMKGRSQ